MKRFSIHAPARRDISRATRLLMTNRIFNPRTPRGCDSSFRLQNSLPRRFQSTQFPRGVRHRESSRMPQHAINPRTGEVRPADGATARQMRLIHAPREGCDGDNSRIVTGRLTFNPRTREGCDSNRLAQALPWPRIFNPRTPARGATRQWQTTSTRGSYFNPRTARGATNQGGRTLSPPPPFQSTHPARGATLRRRPVLPSQAISIHAPREGCDVYFSFSVSSSR